MKKGFTLVELLVVVAILGILAAVGILSYNGFLGKTKEQALRSQHNMIVKFIQGKLGECWLGKEYITTLKHGKEVQTNCNEYFGYFLERNDVYNIEGGDIFYKHFHRGNGYRHILNKTVMQIATGHSESIDGGTAPRPGYSGIAPFSDVNLSGGSSIYKWCEGMSSGIVVVTNLIADNDDWSKNETNYASPFWGLNDTRLFTCISLE